MFDNPEQRELAVLKVMSRMFRWGPDAAQRAQAYNISDDRELHAIRSPELDSQVKIPVYNGVLPIWNNERLLVGFSRPEEGLVAPYSKTGYPVTMIVACDGQTVFAKKRWGFAVHDLLSGVAVFGGGANHPCPGRVDANGQMSAIAAQPRSGTHNRKTNPLVIYPTHGQNVRQP